MRRFLFVLCVVGMVGCFEDLPAHHGPVFPPGTMQPGMVDEAAALAIARQAVAIADPRAEHVDYEANVDGKGWWILAHLRGIDSAGNPQSGGGTIRSIYIDDRGNVTNYLRSK